MDSTVFCPAGKARQLSSARLLQCELSHPALSAYCFRAVYKDTKQLILQVSRPKHCAVFIHLINAIPNVREKVQRLPRLKISSLSTINSFLKSYLTHSFICFRLYLYTQNVLK